MEWLENWVSEVKPAIIGVVHLLPLPGSPKALPMPKVLERALSDAKSLEKGGVDGLIVENYGDVPFYPDSVPPEAVAAMSVVSWAIRGPVDLPIGINVLRNDVLSAIAIATVVGGKFIRANVLTGAYLTDQGLIESSAHKALRYRRSLGSKVEILADVRVKHALPLVSIPVEEEARDLLDRELADGLILTGKRTGVPPDAEELKRVRIELPRAPIFIGSGFEPHRMSLLSLADGAIVGTYFRRGDLRNPVDQDRVRELVDAAKNLARA